MKYVIVYYTRDMRGHVMKINIACMVTLVLNDLSRNGTRTMRIVTCNNGNETGTLYTGYISFEKKYKCLFYFFFKFHNLYLVTSYILKICVTIFRFITVS